MAELNLKQQRFVDAYLISGNATDAARKAGYAHPTTQGPRLLENVGVKAAIEKEHKRGQEKTRVTRESMTEMFMEDRKFAKECGSPSAAATASANLAKLHGLFVDRSVSSAKPIDQMTEVELRVVLGMDEDEIEAELARRAGTRGD